MALVDWSKKDNWWTSLTILVLIGAITTGIYYYYYATHYMPHVLLKNYYLNVWFAFLLAYFALESLVLQCQSERVKKGKYCVIANNAFFIMMSIVYLETSASWDVYGRTDIGILSAAIIVVSLFNIYVVSSKNSFTEGTPESSETNAAAVKRVKPKRATKGASVTESTALISESSDDSCIEHEIAEAKRESRNKCVSMNLFCCALIFRSILLTLSILLMTGGLIHGVGTQNFPPVDGKFIVMPDGNKCTTLKDNTTTTNETTIPSTSEAIFVVGDLDKGMADFLGLYDLVALDDRYSSLEMCVWDPPGLGYSDYTYPMSAAQLAEELVAFLRELSTVEERIQKKFFLVGYEDGGNLVLHLADKHRDLVSQVLIINTLKPDFKRQFLDDHDVSSELSEVLFDTSAAEVNFHNMFGIPLGLNKAFLPRKNTSLWREDSANEQRWCELTEKRWAMKLWDFEKSWYDVVREKDEVEPIASQVHNESYHNAIVLDPVPVSVLVSSWNKQQIERLVCRPRRLSKSDCEMWKQVMTASSNHSANLVANGGSLFTCKEDLCHKDYFIFDQPQYTVDILMELSGNELF